MDELCHNEMSRDHDAPVEYLRILASLKLRFGLAALATAHGALPVCFPIEVKGHSPSNGCLGRQALPMEAEGRLADFVDWRIRLKDRYPGRRRGCLPCSSRRSRAIALSLALTEWATSVLHGRRQNGYYSA